jgi:ribonuclease-3
MWKKGPDHKPEFGVAALLNGTKIAEGEGKSKRQAEAEAAKNALQTIKKQDGENK